jgi:hypothetical protein
MEAVFLFPPVSKQEKESAGPAVVERRRGGQLPDPPSHESSKKTIDIRIDLQQKSRTARTVFRIPFRVP